MRKKTSTPLGFLMEVLDITTVRLAKYLHVDASLVSKWRSGDRKFSVKSVYYNDILKFVLEESEKSEHRILNSAFTELFPANAPENEEDLKQLIHRLLSDSRLPSWKLETDIQFDGGNRTVVTTFEGNAGHRSAISGALRFAEELTEPGSMLFVDSEEFEWLIEDSEYVRSLVSRLESLFERGFRARFLIHFTNHRERFVRFIENCHFLIFHRNVEWLCFDTYDDTKMNYSLCVLNKTLSLVSLSSENTSSTIAFTDTATILAHESLANTIISNSPRLFVDFPPCDFGNVVEHIQAIRKRGAIYVYLPAPAFVAAREELLREILQDNDIPQEEVEQCLRVNQRMRNIVMTQFEGLSDTPERIIQIFQQEEMLKRIRSVPFTSCSLSLLGGKDVTVTKAQYAECIRNLAQSLVEHPNLEVAFLSSSEVPSDAPTINEFNLWCKQNTWMVQMDKEGFRISDEVSIVNATSITLERCLRRIPPERKEKYYVVQHLLNLANSVETGDISTLD